MFGVGGDGWYNASPNGLSSTNPRIRLKFAMDKTTDSAAAYALFSTGTIPLIYNCSIDKTTNDVYISRYNKTNNKTFEIATNLPLNDGNWHSIDVSISTPNNTIDIVVDGKVFPRITDSENTPPGEIKTSAVFLGGFANGNSFHGFIKDIWFGDVQKTDIAYQFNRNRGKNGGKVI